MKTNIVSGATLAVAAFALAASGAVSPASAKKAAKPVHCVGVNACKGMAACKTANNSCKGMNSCKGQGWVEETSAKACAAKGGTVETM
jgi:hypothetical protein